LEQFNTSPVLTQGPWVTVLDSYEGLCDNLDICLAHQLKYERDGILAFLTEPMRIEVYSPDVPANRKCIGGDRPASSKMLGLLVVYSEFLEGGINGPPLQPCTATSLAHCIIGK